MRLAILVVSVAALTAQSASATRTVQPPAAAKVAAALVSHGATRARCIEPAAGAYVCVFDHAGFCVEAEYVWLGSWARFPGHLVAARKGRCWKPPASTPPA